jgi:hypothetical protein
MADNNGSQFQAIITAVQNIVSAIGKLYSNLTTSLNGTN